MMKPDEKEFLLALFVEAEKPLMVRKPTREVGAGVGIPPRRVAYICEKWSRKGWYNYGVSVDMGWLEAPGLEAARGLTAEGA